MGEEIGIYYHTSDGQTEKVAEYIGNWLRERGRWSVIVEEIGRRQREPIWPMPTAMVVGAPVHGGEFAARVRRFVELHRSRLETTVSAFFALSLSEADANEGRRQEVHHIIDQWLEAMEWKPDEVASIAGATPFSRYGRLKRWVMRKVVAELNPGADVDEDREYTDWEAVNSFADRIAERVDVARAARPGTR